jgi:hypothetical protein
MAAPFFTPGKKAVPISLLLHALLLFSLFYADYMDKIAISLIPKKPEFVEVHLAEKPTDVGVGSVPVAAAPALVAKSSEKSAPVGLARLLQHSSRPIGSTHAHLESADGVRMQHELSHLAQNSLPAMDSSATSGIRGALASAQQQKAQTKYSWGGIGEITDSNSEAIGDTSAIVAALSKYQSEFRECYERALFVDASIAGKAQFLIGISGSGSVSLSKVSLKLAKSQSQAAPGLQSCLEGVGKKVHFPSTVGQQSIQFGLLLRS